MVGCTPGGRISCYRPHVHPRSFAISVAVVGIILAGCTTSNEVLTNEFGGCTFEPGATCRDEDLVAVTASESDLRGADLSGSNLKNADLTNVDLRDANLSGTSLISADLTGADLRGADLSQATVYDASFERAHWAGSNRTGIQYCRTILPDGGVSNCPAIDGIQVPFDQTPPEVVHLAARRPVVCLDDFVGDGIEIDWEVAHAQYVVFLVDDIQAAIADGTSGVKRIPFQCDGEPHTVTIQAFALVRDIGTDSITVTVRRRVGP